MDAAFWTDHRAFLVSTITNLRTVILKLSTNPRASYSIDTGQGKETVTAASLSMLRNLMNGYIAELQQIDDDLAGTGDPVCTRPGW